MSPPGTSRSACGSCSTPWARWTTRCRRPLRERHGLVGLATALRGIHRPADLAEARPRPDPAQVGRGPRAAGRAGPAPPGRRRPAGHRPPAPGGRPAGRVRRAAAVQPHRGPARRGRDHRRRPGPHPPHAPAAAGRGRLRQDRDRGAGDAAGDRRGRAGRAARPDRGARAAALPVGHRPARPARAGGTAGRRGPGDPGGAADRLPARRRRAARRCSTPRPARPGS